MTSYMGDLDRFYTLMNQLRALPEQGRRLSDCAGRQHWPTRGVYFFVEDEEVRRDANSTSRIVRVGTHALGSRSKSTLWGRLRGHRGNRTGHGNHRCSIFRLHVGAALLTRDGFQLPTWGVRSSAPAGVRTREADHEVRVSMSIGAMRVLWVTVPDEPGPDSARGFIEKNAIALLSNQLRPIDQPSPGWLGRHSARREIRESGLWNVDYVEDLYDPAFIDVLEGFVECICEAKSAT